MRFRSVLIISLACLVAAFAAPSDANEAPSSADAPWIGSSAGQSELYSVTDYGANRPQKKRRRVANKRPPASKKLVKTATPKAPEGVPPPAEKAKTAVTETASVPDKRQSLEMCAKYDATTGTTFEIVCR